VIPPSGSFFPLGTTGVVGIATDVFGEADTCSFTVTVNDMPSAIFVIDPDTLNYTVMKRGSLPDSQRVEVSNAGRCGDIPYELTETASWLSVSPSAGETPSTFDVFIDDTDVAPGEYWELIRLTESSLATRVPSEPVQDSVWVKLTVETPPMNAVTVGSRSAIVGASGVRIPIRLSNEVPLNAIDIPLVFREVTPGSYVTALTMQYEGRLPEQAGAPLSGVIAKDTYPVENGACKNGQGGGFGTSGGLDYVSPDAIVFSRRRLLSDPPLYPGSDVSASLILVVDVTSVSGSFEIDTTCVDPGTHISFFEDGSGTPILPAFTKGIVTLVDACDCPTQADIEPDGFLTALDLSACIDILFAGRLDVRDPICPSPRFDLDCDGFSTALDLAVIIDHLFAGGVGPCDPCAP
jgi:hypothetical protein